jgi:hypothetical protein
MVSTNWEVVSVDEPVEETRAGVPLDLSDADLRALLADIPDTPAEMFGEALVADTPLRVEPVSVPAPVRAPEPVDDFVPSDHAVRTGSDYVFYSAVTAGVLAVGGAVSLVGYVLYALTVSLFGASVAIGAGLLPLLVLAGVVVLCARGRGASVSGLPVPGVGSLPGGLLSTVGGGFGRLGRFRAVTDSTVAVGAYPDGTQRRASLLASTFGASSPDPAAVAAAEAVAAGGAPAPAMLTPMSVESSRGGQGVLARGASRLLFGPAEALPQRGVLARAGARVLGSSTTVTTPVAAPVGARRVSLLGRIAGVPAAQVTSRGAVLGAPYRSVWSQMLLGGSGPAPVAPGGKPQSVVSRLMFGDTSPTAQVAAVMAGRQISFGVVGALTGARRRVRAAESSSADDRMLAMSSDVPIVYLVGMGDLTTRWVRRMRMASQDDQVFQAWRVKSYGKCRYCAVGFLWDEFDPNGWYSVGSVRGLRTGTAYLHRDAAKIYKIYGVEWLWNVVNMYESQEFTLQQIASHVEREVGSRAKSA